MRWANGAPSGSIESDPWVQAVREGELAYAAAVNSSNFTDPSLLTTWHEEHVQWFATTAARRLDDGTAFIMSGPHPFRPLEVDGSASDREASVVGCGEDAAVRPASDDREGPNPQAVEFRLERTPDGHRRIVSVGPLAQPYELAAGDLLTDDYCRSVPLPHGLFDPEPDPAAMQTLAGDDVIAPRQHRA